MTMPASDMAMAWVVTLVLPLLGLTAALLLSEWWKVKR